MKHLCRFKTEIHRTLAERHVWRVDPGVRIRTTNFTNARPVWRGNFVDGHDKDEDQPDRIITGR